MKSIIILLLVGLLTAPSPAQDQVADDAVVDRLRAKGMPTVDELRSALGAESESLGRLAARIMVHEVAELSGSLLSDIFVDRIARGRLLAALATRPRRELGEWLRAALPSLALTTTERLQALAVLTNPDLSRAEAREILDGAMSKDILERSLALLVADRMSIKQADLMVAEVHKRCLAGVSLELLLPYLSQVSARGELHLIGLARTLPVDQRTEIAEWLSLRSSPRLQEFLLDGLRGHFPLPPILLHLLHGPIENAEDLQSLLDLLEDASGAMQRAAYRVLCGLREYHPALLKHVLAVPAQAGHRVRSLLSMKLPSDAMLTLLSDPEPDVVLPCLRKMSAGTLRGALEGKVFGLAEGEGQIADLAARVILTYARPATALRLWDLLAVDRRQEFHPALRGRQAWALALVIDLPLDSEDWGLRQTRIVLGDAEQVRNLLANYAAWPTAWLRRIEVAVTRELGAENVPVIESLLAAGGGLDEIRRAYLAACLAGRPDLGGDRVLRRLYLEDADAVVRAEALIGLLRRPQEASRLFAILEAGIGVDPLAEFDELAYEVAGNLQAPLSAGQARLLARLLLVAPLGDSQPQKSAAAAEDAVPSNLGMVNLAGRILRSGASETVFAAFSDAVDEARAHQHRQGYDPRYLTALLSALCFDAEMRIGVGPLVAGLILEAEGVDSQWLGPAWLIAAESAVAAQQWQQAADAYGRAGSLFLRHPLPPLQRRLFLGDELPGTSLGLGAVFARRDLCQARARWSVGDLPAARRALKRATIFCYGDQSAEAELRILKLEFAR